MTMTIKGDDRVLLQVNKQLNRLVDVVAVSDLTQKEHVSAELLLIEVKAGESAREEMKALAESHGAIIVCVHADSVTMQLAGDLDKIEDFLSVFKSEQILDITRTGVIISPRDGECG
jgi:acetolactate synthase-1/3 small subunit